jgi:putative ABC transport system ATP-binding protein
MTRPEPESKTRSLRERLHRPRAAGSEPARAPAHTQGVRQAPRPRALIEVSQVTKTYQLGTVAVHALRGVSLQIERGEYVAIMGSSGSGKSTLMNILGCLDLPSQGVYRLDGIDVRHLDQVELADVRNRKLGFVFQSFNLIPRMSALANVELPLAYAGMERAERRVRALDALEQVGIADRAAFQPSELSGGQQQRTAVARAVVTNPALILADEPTGNLDSHSTADIMRVFDRLNQSGRTVALITHEPEVAHHANRVIHLSDGEIVSDERQDDLHGPPLHADHARADGASAAEMGSR